MISIQKYKIKLSYLATILIFLSLGVNPSFVDNKTINFKDIINLVRFFLPSIFLIGIYIFYPKKYKFKYFINLDLKIKILFYLFLIILFFSFLVDITNSQNLYFFSYLNIFLFAGLLNSNKDEDEIINNLILFIILGIFIFLLLMLLEIFSNQINFSELHKSSVFSFDNRFLSQSLPRSTGVSKFMLLFLLVLMFLFYKKHSISVLSAITFFSSTLVLLNSRTSLIFYYFFIFFIIFYINQKFKIKAQLIVATLLIPIIVFVFVPNKTYNISKENYISTEKLNILENFSKKFSKNKKEIIEDDNNLITKKNDSENYKLGENEVKKEEYKKNDITSLLNKNNNNQLNKIENISSGRIYLWKIIYNDFRENKINLFVGKGILADKKIYTQSSSNGFIYSFLAGGVLGFLSLIILNILILKDVLPNIIKTKQLKRVVVLDLFVLFLIYRLLFENGFVLYVSDLYLLITCIFFINLKKLKN